MNCSNCKNEKAWHVVSRFSSETGDFEECCDACGLEGAGPGMPDAYFQRAGQTFQNLCDKMGRPIEIQSKRHKQEVMNKLGVSEAGGTVNGAPYGTKNWIEGTRDYRRKQFDKDRPMIRETLKAWKEKSRAK